MAYTALRASRLAVFVCCLMVAYAESTIPCVDGDGNVVAVGGKWWRCDGLCCKQRCTCMGADATCGSTMCASQILPANCTLADAPQGSNCCPVTCA